MNHRGTVRIEWRQPWNEALQQVAHFKGRAPFLIPPKDLICLRESSLLDDGSIQCSNARLYVCCQQSGPPWLAYVAKTKFDALFWRIFDRVGRTLSYTKGYILNVLWIWELASWDLRTVPRWRDIHFIGWLCRKFTKEQDNEK